MYPLIHTTHKLPTGMTVLLLGLFLTSMSLGSCTHAPVPTQAQGIHATQAQDIQLTHLEDTRVMFARWSAQFDQLSPQPFACTSGYYATLDGYVIAIADWAEQGGLRRGDKILSIAGISVPSQEDRAQALAQVSAGGPLVIGISRASQALLVSLPCIDDTKIWAARKKALTAGVHGDWDTCLIAIVDVQRFQGFVTSNNLKLALTCAENRTIVRRQPLGHHERTLLYNSELLALRETRYVPEGLDKIRGRILTSISRLQRAGFALLAVDLEAELQKAQQEETTKRSAPPAVTALSMTEEISLVKVGGVYALPVDINGVLTLNFILDSGASEVNIPADVVFTLLRSGTIRDTDFLPGKTYVLADGSKLKSPRFMLRSLKIGRRHITDIPASVGNLTSGLLLGQSLLERLGGWGIDNQKNILVIHPGASQ